MRNFSTCEINSSLFGIYEGFQTLLVQMPGFGDSHSLELFASGKVDSVLITGDIIADYLEVRDILYAMTLIFAGISVIFITVVVYNLAVLTRMERAGEIRILEQIGYTELNINQYLFREVMLIAVFGIILSCIIGVLTVEAFLGTFDGNSTKGESITYIKHIYWGGLAISVLITLGQLAAAFWWNYLFKFIKIKT